MSMSGTGQYLIGERYNRQGGSYVVISTTYGASTSTYVGIDALQYVQVSVTGQYMLASPSGSGYLYISSNYGSSFTSKLLACSWTFALVIAISSTGQYMAASSNNDAVSDCGASNSFFVSSDYGASWVTKSSSMCWKQIVFVSVPTSYATSGVMIVATGTVLDERGVCGYYVNFLKSLDLGTTWTTIFSAAVSATIPAIPGGAVNSIPVFYKVSDSDSFYTYAFISASTTSLNNVFIGCPYIPTSISSNGQVYVTIDGAGKLRFSSLQFSPYLNTWSSAVSPVAGTTCSNALLSGDGMSVTVFCGTNVYRATTIITPSPTMFPSSQPSEQPTIQPSAQPTMHPSNQPTSQPSEQPSKRPSTQPSKQPSMQPSVQPSSQPSVQPSIRPSNQPSTHPTMQPSEQPSEQPSVQPSTNPSKQPTSQPTRQPSTQPTEQPSEQPSNQPTAQPSQRLQPPTLYPTPIPTYSPSTNATLHPTQPTNVITTIAGNTNIGDGGAPSNATFDQPKAVAVDTTGNVYVADTGGNRIRVVTKSTGMITTYAGTGGIGNTGDGDVATSAQLNSPTGVAVDLSGNVYVADMGNNRVRLITKSSGIISVTAGTGKYGSSGDGGLAYNAQLALPMGVAVDVSGNVYIADNGNNKIRVVSSTGIITTFAGTGTYGNSGDGGPASSATLQQPTQVAVDVSGNVYASTYCIIKFITKISGIITTFAGTVYNGNGGNGIPATSVSFRCSWDVVGVVTDTLGNVYISDVGDAIISVVKTTNGILSTFAGGSTVNIGDGLAATNARLAQPAGLAVDISGNVYIADSVDRRIRMVTVSTGIIKTFAGSDFHNGMAATLAHLGNPTDVCVDSTGNIYIPDSDTHRVYRVTVSTGVMNIVAGNGYAGYNGDGLQATAAQLNEPYGVASDMSGNLYIVERCGLRVRIVKVTSGLIGTIAGTGGWQGINQGDGGPATSAQLGYPSGVAVDTSGNVYIADNNNNRVRMVTKSTGFISTVAGTGTYGSIGDGGLSYNAQLFAPNGVAVDVSGNVYIADQYSLRLVTKNTGIINTVVSHGGSPGLYTPVRVAVDASGNVYVADTAGNNKLIYLSMKGTGSAVKFAGTGMTGSSGDGGLATSALLSNPYGVAVGANGNVYIVDQTSKRIRVVTPNTPTCTPGYYVSGAVCAACPAGTFSPAVTSLGVSACLVGVPTSLPTASPIFIPTSQPTQQPTEQPSRQPSGQPSVQPSAQPSEQPSQQPSTHPSRQPSTRPTCQPTTQVFFSDNVIVFFYLASTLLPFRSFPLPDSINHQSSNSHSLHENQVHNHPDSLPRNHLDTLHDPQDR